MALRPSCFRKFLKNTGHFQPCPPFVLKTFSKTQGGFRAARWDVVCGRKVSFVRRFEIQVSAIRVDYFEPRTQNRFPFNWRHKPFLRTDVLWSGFFRVSEPKTDFFCLTLSRNFSGCDLSEQNGTVCGQEFFRELVANSICVERPLSRLPACPAPPPPGAKKKRTTAPPPVRQNTGSFTKTLEFQRHFRR